MTGVLLVLLYAVLAALGAAFVMWPNRLNTTIVASIDIDRPIEMVFDYVTTPKNWPEWHPASRSVSGATDHSLGVGETVEEDFVAAGRAGRCVWTVARREAPTLWAITTQVGDMGAEIVYRLSSQGGATRFERSMTYWTSGFFIGLLDIFVMRGRNRRESRTALGRLKERLEGSAASKGR